MADYKYKAYIIFLNRSNSKCTKWPCKCTAHKKSSPSKANQTLTNLANTSTSLNPDKPPMAWSSRYRTLSSGFLRSRASSSPQRPQKSKWLLEFYLILLISIYIHILCFCVIFIRYLEKSYFVLIRLQNLTTLIIYRHSKYLQLAVQDRVVIRIFYGFYKIYYFYLYSFIYSRLLSK